MNLLTYWFNPGIYKNTLRRFKWGSILYAVIMFFCVPFAFFTREPEEFIRRYSEIDGTVGCALFNSGMYVLPFMMAFVVPTVVALLVFNYAHSPKHGVFVHSLPVTRAQNYFSTLLAAFTLMFAPVILNAGILFIFNAGAYGPVLGAFNIFKWVMIQIFIMFVMFSIASAASFITGNAFASMALNAIIHLLPIAIALIIFLIGGVFLYGYDTNDPAFTMDIVTHTPFVWMASKLLLGTAVEEQILTGATGGYAVLAVAFYAAAFFLYKLRKVENCGDVIAFAAAKPIVKYTLTTIAASLVLGVLGVLELVPAVTAFTVAAIICAIVYFACEMLMNKTLKVWGKYKGYLTFCVCVAAVLSFCAYTSVFGYETRVPDAEDVESVSISTGYFEYEPYSGSPEAALAATEFHKKLIEERPVRDVRAGWPIYIQYKLKNGNIIERSYYTEENLREEAMHVMFAFEDYKMSYTGFDKLDIEKIDSLNLTVNCPNFSYVYALNEDSVPFLSALKEDIKNISYEEFKAEENIRFYISYYADKEEVLLADDAVLGSYYFDVSINSNFTNTIEFLKEKGYYDLAMWAIADNMFITKTTHAKAEEYIDGEKVYSRKYPQYEIGAEDIAKIVTEDAYTLMSEHLIGEKSKFVSEETYLVFVSKSYVEFRPSSCIIEFTPETLPEYLRKYVE